MLADSDVDIRRLDSCTFGEALRLWNEGFAGYPFDMTLSLDAYLSRLAALGLSPELSLAAFVGGRPAGFVLNGLVALAAAVLHRRLRDLFVPFGPSMLAGALLTAALL